MKVAELILSSAVKVAEKSFGAASVYGLYQPKEPDNLAERLEEMKKSTQK
jgi:cyclic lactone autoinducer peptide